MYVGHRLLRTQFLPLFVQRCWRKVGITFGRLMRFSRCVSRKRKIPPMQHSDGFCRVKQRQNESGVLRGGKFFCGLSLTEVVGLTVITNHFLWLCSKWTRPHLVDGFKPIHKISGICDREYHGLLGASRWFCKIYCGKATKVCLIWGILFQSLRKYDSFLTDVKKSRNLFSETSRGGAAFQRTKS